MGTAFTYQGKLIDANYPAEGLYDFQFRLYGSSDPCDSNQVGSDVNVPERDVIDGYFTVLMDFNDANAFRGDARWLEIGVRPGEMSDPNLYEVLEPRQEITVTPYALYALKAETASGDGDWTISDSNIYSAAIGNVGIGTSNPTAKLTINGAILKATSYILGAANTGSHVNLGWYSTTGTPGGYESSMTIGGGTSNTVTGGHATISGGSGHEASGTHATVGGGESNIASGYSSTLSGGLGNEASGSHATIAGGQWNQATYTYATVGGGLRNVASGYGATIAGGMENEASGERSFAAGWLAKAKHNGSFVWADKTPSNFASSGDNQFLIRASGGVGIDTNSPSNKLDVEGSVAVGASYSGSTAAPANGMIIEGNVGIGTISVGGNLHLHDSFFTSLRFSNDGTGTAGTYGAEVSMLDDDFRVVNKEPANLHLGTSNSLNLTIDQIGSVGIGTTSPESKLDIQGGMRVKGESWPGSGEGLEFGYNSGSNTGTIQAYDRATSSWGELYLGSGNVGIGISNPDYKLDVRGDRIQLKDDTGDWIAMRADGGGLDLQFEGGALYVQSTTDGEHILLNPNRNSNVCIGATGPTERLDVAGTARLRGIAAQAGANYVHVDGNGKLWKTTSSKKYKTKIRDLDTDPMAVLQLRPVKYQCKVSGKEDIGLIAEEVDRVLKDLVMRSTDGSPEAVKYDRVSLYLLSVVKELKTENDSLKQRLEALEEMMDSHFTVAKEVQR
jgi:hypothetical protein